MPKNRLQLKVLNMDINYLKISLYALVCFFSLNFSAAQNVGISDAGSSFTPDASSVLELKSTTRGLLTPRLTTAQKNAIAAPLTGLLVYDTSLNLFYYYNGTAWVPLFSTANGWSLTGNGSTTAGTNYLGTSDAIDLVFKTTGSERMRIAAGGNLVIGATVPRGQFDVAGTGDVYLANNTVAGTSQSLFLPGHILIAPYNGSDISYLQARRSDNSGSTNLQIRTYNAGTLINSMYIQYDGKVGLATSAPAFTFDNNSANVTNSKFGASLPLYITAANPGFGFNSYYDGVSSFLFGPGSVAGTHYGGNLAFAPATGAYTFQCSNATGVAGGTVTNLTSLSITRTGLNIFLNGVYTSGANWLQYDGNTIIAYHPTNNNLYAGKGAGAQYHASATDNTCLGYNAGNVLAAANYNTLIGSQAGLYRTTGGSNTCVGNLSGMGVAGSTATGQYNTFLGFQSGTLITTGANNEVIGVAARALSSGSGNVIIGHTAGDAITNGSNNTFIGNTAAVAAASGTSNSAAIGNGATVTADNNMIFGNSSVIGWGFGTTPGAAALKVGTGASNGSGATLTVGGV
jgi:hypothetical protein